MLKRYNLVASQDHDEACSRLNQLTGGRRIMRDARPASPDSPHIVNAIRLGGVRLMVNRMPACSVHVSGHTSGLVFMVMQGGMSAVCGRRRIDVGPGSIGCIMPAGDRLTSFEQGTTAVILSLPLDLVAETLEDWGSPPDYAWADAFAQVPGTLTSAGRLMGLSRDIIRAYDSEQPPSPRNDVIFGHSLLAAGTTMLAEMFRRPFDGAGTSYVLARRAEDAIIENLAAPMSVSSLARDLGTTPARLRRSLMMHRGVSLPELRDYIRVLAAERTPDAGPASAPWRAAGFRNAEELARARTRQDETAAKIAGRRLLPPRR